LDWVLNKLFDFAPPRTATVPARKSLRSSWRALLLPVTDSLLLSLLEGNPRALFPPGGISTPQSGEDERMERQDILELIGSIVIAQLAGQIGAIATSASVQTWYITLNKPIFTPPNWLFAPVWITLYTLMGLSLFLIWRLGLQTRGVNLALALFGVQLLLNTLWSIAFFGLRSPLAGLVVIIPLWIAIAATIALFLPLSRPAGMLLIPYLLWVSLAAALNAAILLLN